MIACVLYGPGHPLRFVSTGDCSARCAETASIGSGAVESVSLCAMKRTNVVLDEDLLEEAVRPSGERFTPGPSSALHEMVRRAKARGIDQLAVLVCGRATWVRCAVTTSAVRETRGVYRPGSDVFLVDTSAWIEVFRRGSRLTVDQLVPDRDLIVTCPPVIQEVLQGFDDERAFKIARTAMLALPCVVCCPSLHHRGCGGYLSPRAQAGSDRALERGLPRSCAATYHLTVVHRDRDYAQIARVIALDHRDIGRLAKDG